MEPASLPLEIMLQIMSWVEPRATWRLRTVSRAWRDTLSSPPVESQALGGTELSVFKALHLSKPLSSSTVQCSWQKLENNIAMAGRYVAYYNYKDWKGTGRKLWLSDLYIQDLEGVTIKKAVPTDEPILDIVMDEVVVLVSKACCMLFIYTLEGVLTKVPLPEGYEGGIISTRGTRIAVLLKDPQGDPNVSTAVVEPDTLWVYDYVLETWTSTPVPGHDVAARWFQALLMNDDIHVLSFTAEEVEIDDWDEDSIPDEGPSKWTMHVRSPAQGEWSIEYDVPAYHDWTYRSRRCSSYWDGAAWHVLVRGFGIEHSVLLTPERLLSVHHPGQVTRYGLTYDYTCNVGIEAPRGFLWYNLASHYGWTATVALASQDYLFLLGRVQNEAFVIKFGGTKTGLFSGLEWEDKGEDAASQIRRRRRIADGGRSYVH